jgi:hypothetical protein
MVFYSVVTDVRFVRLVDQLALLTAAHSGHSAFRFTVKEEVQRVVASTLTVATGDLRLVRSRRLGATP